MSRAQQREANKAAHAAKLAAMEDARQRARDAKSLARAGARTRAIVSAAPTSPRDEVLTKVRAILDAAMEDDSHSAAVGAARLLLETMPSDEPKQLPFASAREAVAWWRAHEAELVALAEAEGAA